MLFVHGAPYPSTHARMRAHTHTHPDMAPLECVLGDGAPIFPACNMLSILITRSIASNIVCE